MRSTVLVLGICSVLAAASGQTPLTADVKTTSGEAIKGAVLTCGPFGNSSYIQRTRYAKTAAELASGTEPARTIDFKDIARFDYLPLSDEDRKAMGTSQFRDHVLKAKLTFRDKTVWDVVFLPDFCTLKTTHDSAEFNRIGPASVTFVQESTPAKKSK